MSTEANTSSKALTSVSGWDGYWKGLVLPKLPRMLNPCARFEAMFLRSALLRTPGSVTEKSAFELGCAPGAWMAHLARAAGCRVSGCDSSERGAALARENLELLNTAGTVHRGDFFELTEDHHGRHDLVYSLGLVEHFENTEAVLRAHARLCRPGGIVALDVPNLHGLSLLAYRTASSRVLASHKALTPEVLSAAAKRAGLEVLECRYAGPFSAFVLLDRMRRGFWRALGWGLCMALGWLSYPARSKTLNGTVILLAQKPA